ncbi:MAG: response regulator [Desulfatiglans sp.]|jgi:two-component system chemotaxis response regulator CheY|nr:response regulator [Desulfatiglans sp.]
MAYNIMIVDDSKPMRSVIKKTLKASGFDVGRIYEASNGKEALRSLRDEWVDLVLTDYNMPQMNGLELICEMKKDELLRVLPAVLITTEGSLQRVDEFLEKGAAGYIKKPFTPEQIKGTLSMIMGDTDDGQEDDESGDEGLDF